MRTISPYILMGITSWIYLCGIVVYHVSTSYSTFVLPFLHSLAYVPLLLATHLGDEDDDLAEYLLLSGYVLVALCLHLTSLASSYLLTSSEESSSFSLFNALLTAQACVTISFTIGYTAYRFIESGAGGSGDDSDATEGVVGALIDISSFFSTINALTLVTSCLVRLAIFTDYRLATRYTNGDALWCVLLVTLSALCEIFVAFPLSLVPASALTSLAFAWLMGTRSRPFQRSAYHPHKRTAVARGMCRAVRAPIVVDRSALRVNLLREAEA